MRTYTEPYLACWYDVGEIVGMQSRYYVARSGKTLGPFEVEEIVRKIHVGELTMTDYIYLQEKKDWVVIVDFPDIANLVQSCSSPNIAVNSTQKFTLVSADTSDGMRLGDETRQLMVAKKKEDRLIEWFVLKGEDKFGPFSYLELVEMLKGRVVFEFDYIWHAELSSWKRISELEEFHAHAIKKVEGQIKKQPGSSRKTGFNEAFFRRRHARVSYGGSVIVHNNEEVWKGQGLEVSAGGAGLQLNCGDLAVGQTLYLHFQPGDGVPSFNAVCEVITKRATEKKGSAESFRYGVKFKQIGKNARKVINTYARSKVEEAAKNPPKKQFAA